VFTVLSTSYDAEQTLGVSSEMQGFTNSGSNPFNTSFQSSFVNGKYGGGNGTLSTTKEVPRGEINDRFKTVIIKSVDFLINTGM
jgi:hypothetical protein